MDLSLLIPARNEMFLNQTIQSILENRRGATEIIAGLDGQWPVDPVPDHERVNLVYSPTPIGQRAITNDCARVARGYYVMKLDAHCSVAPGFDIAMLEAFEETGEDVTMVPLMRNLHAFDWVCPNGHRRYQGPSGPCKVCDEATTRDMIWHGKESPQSRSYAFDSEPHFCYFREFSRRPEGKGDLTETMSLQGSCFMLTKQRYFELNICDESWGTWGSQGIEVACKTWLSGGRCLVNQRTWYGHMFRTQGADFGFPYPLSGKQVAHAKEKAREMFYQSKWPQQARPLSWLIEKFWPVPGWTEADLERLKATEPTFAPVQVSEPEPQTSDQEAPSKGIVYYTDNRLDGRILAACQRQLLKTGLPIVSVSLKPLEFGKNITINAERGTLTLFRQQLAGLEASEADWVFLCEHDVLYHPSHFDFTPPRADTFYYNTHVWKVRASDGHCVWTDDLQQVSGVCASRQLLIEFYRRRIAEVEANGFDRHYEPGEKTGGTSANWQSEWPNLDIRHDGNMTKSKWKPEEFRDKRYAKGWKEAGEVPGWGTIEGRFWEWLEEASRSPIVSPIVIASQLEQAIEQALETEAVR